MAKWATENQTQFYMLYGKLLPKVVDVDATKTIDAWLQQQVLQHSQDSSG